MKTLNIGMVGYGFMGRTHSNAFLRVNNFFDIPYRPVLKTVCARSPERARAFAEKWGYSSVETDWRALVIRMNLNPVIVKFRPGLNYQNWHLVCSLACGVARAGQFPCSCPS